MDTSWRAIVLLSQHGGVERSLNLHILVGGRIVPRSKSQQSLFCNLRVEEARVGCRFKRIYLFKLDARLVRRNWRHGSGWCVRDGESVAVASIRRGKVVVLVWVSLHVLPSVLVPAGGHQEQLWPLFLLIRHVVSYFPIVVLLGWRDPEVVLELRITSA